MCTCVHAMKHVHASIWIHTHMNTYKDTPPNLAIVTWRAVNDNQQFKRGGGGAAFRRTAWRFVNFLSCFGVLNRGRVLNVKSTMVFFGQYSFFSSPFLVWGFYTHLQVFLCKWFVGSSFPSKCQILATRIFVNHQCGVPRSHTHKGIHTHTHMHKCTRTNTRIHIRQFT